MLQHSHHRPLLIGLVLALGSGYAMAEDIHPVTHAVRSQESEQRGLESQTQGSVRDLKDLIDQYRFNGLGRPAQLKALQALGDALSKMADPTASVTDKNMPWVTTRLATARDLQNLKAIRDELVTAGSGQDQIIAELNKLINKAQKQFGAIGANNDLREIAKEQAKIKDLTAQVAEQTVGKDADQLTDEQKSDVNKAAAQQTALQQALNNAVEDLKNQAKEAADTDPQQAKALDQAAQALAQKNVQDTMQQAATNIANNKMLDAQAQQQQVMDALKQAQQQLDQSQNQSDQVAQLENQLNQVNDLVQQQQDLLDKTQAMDPNAQQQDFNQLQTAQADLQNQLGQVQAPQQGQQDPQQGQQDPQQAQQDPQQGQQDPQQAQQDPQQGQQDPQQGQQDPQQGQQDPQQGQQQAAQAMGQAQQDLGNMAKQPAAGAMQKALANLQAMQQGMQQQLAQMTGQDPAQDPGQDPGQDPQKGQEPGNKPGQPKPGPPGPASKLAVQDQGHSLDHKATQLGAELKYGQRKTGDASGANWAVNLPPEQRQALDTSAKAKFPSQYEHDLSLYYQNLAAAGSGNTP